MKGVVTILFIDFGFKVAGRHIFIGFHGNGVKRLLNKFVPHIMYNVCCDLVKSFILV